MSTGLRNTPFFLKLGRRVGESKRVKDFPDPNRKKTVFKFFAVDYQLTILISGFVNGKIFFH